MLACTEGNVSVIKMINLQYLSVLCNFHPFFIIYIEAIWIVGDSMVYWAARFLLPGGERWLNLHLSNFTVTWKGERGAHLTSVPDVLAESSQNYIDRGWYAPRVVVIHMGGNDLQSLDIIQFKNLLEELLLQCKQILPHTFFIWSDILPRHHYQGARSQKGMDIKRKSLNKTARQLFLANEGRVIRHGNIHWSNICLFREDSIHLSDLGNQMFTNNLMEALNLFRNNPDVLVYSPN